MKRTISTISALFLAVMIVSSIPLFSKGPDASGQITDGKEYWFGIPNCLRDKTEPVRWGKYPINLWISSKVKTTATVESLDGTLFPRTWTINPNEITVVEIPDQLESTESEIKSDKGIHILAKDPINVGVFVAYKWSGEAFRVTPVEWLGTKYYTLNMYQDEVKMYTGYTEYKPAEILITATQDNTIIKYKPSAETEAGITKGTLSPAVKLNKGQSFLIKAKVFPARNQDWSTDLTGTYIEATKPVAVISGHTKGAFPRFGVVFLGSLKSDFMRNMLIDMMWPVELLGRDYVSAPIKYRGRTYSSENLIQNLEGDIIRFVATVDGTIVYKMRQDGTDLMQISNKMKAGEWYDILDQKEPCFYHANNPVLVGQYGKAWWTNIVGNKKDEQKGEINNPHNNGQGMMFALTPIEQWCSYSSFKSPEAMDNFFYLTFKTDQQNFIYFDGQKITTKFGTSCKKIQGTEYSFITETVSPGSHWVDADSGVKFGGYAYGNWDYQKDGFAYGYPIGINYALTCVDSLFVIDTTICGDITGTAFDVPQDSSCAKIFNVSASDEVNYDDLVVEPDKNKPEKIVSYYMNVTDKRKPAHAIVTSVSRSGLRVAREYNYEPEQITADPTFVNFGLVQLNETKELSFKITNTGKTKAQLKNIKLKSGKAEFAIESLSFPIWLEPNESKVVKVTATALVLAKVPVEDSIIVDMSCYSDTPVGLRLTTGEPIVWIDDASWGQLPVGVEVQRSVEIRNEGTIPVELTSMTWKDHTHFTRTSLDAPTSWPIKLDVGERTSFNVWYKPNVPGVEDRDTAFFVGNTQKVKLYSAWNGSGIEAGPLITGYDWKKKRVIDQYSENILKVKEYTGTITINNTGNTKLDVVDVVIENSFGGVLSIDKTSMPTQLSPNTPVDLPVKFIPFVDGKDAIHDYTSKITFKANFNNDPKEAVAVLHGSEMQPHVDVQGNDYGPAVLSGVKVPGNGSVLWVKPQDDITSMPLTITGLKITGPDAASFTIDNSFYTQYPDFPATPIVLPQGSMPLLVPITFTADNVVGTKTAFLEAETDAPENPKGELIGRVTSQGIEATNYNYGVLFVTQSKPGVVYLYNTGDKDAVLTSTIQPTGGDATAFRVNKWWLVSNPTALNPAVPITLKAHDSIAIEVNFTPVEARAYNTQINYETSVGLAKSQLIGEGQILKTVCSIPKNYEKIPGQPFLLDVNIEKDATESKLLETAGITYFKTLITFKRPGHDPSVYPAVKSPADIITQGTMTEGWTVKNVSVNSEAGVIEAEFTGTKPLAGNSTLFQFYMSTFLTDTNYVDLPVEFVPTFSPWVKVTDIPGLVKLMPVCVNDARLIKMTNTAYALSAPSPNPAGDKTSIIYNVGLEAQTTIDLYNNFGQKIATLLNEVKAPGSYKLDLDMRNLDIPSGTYHYIMNSGPYTETQELVIVK